MPRNRSLQIAVTFNCTHLPNGEYGGTATYAQSACDPPDMGNLVDADGTIHLDRAAAYDANAYTQNVDLQFTLASPAQVTPDNTTLPVNWATHTGPGVTIVAPPGSNGSEFQVVASPGNPNVIDVIDRDDDSNVYNYKPAVELPTVNNYYISLDPQIVNRAN